MDAGLDFVVVGRGAILHHDFPEKVKADPDFTPIALPLPGARAAAPAWRPEVKR